MLMQTGSYRQVVRKQENNLIYALKRLFSGWWCSAMCRDAKNKNQSYHSGLNGPNRSPSPHAHPSPLWLHLLPPTSLFYSFQPHQTSCRCLSPSGCLGTCSVHLVFPLPGMFFYQIFLELQNGGTSFTWLSGVTIKQSPGQLTCRSGK